MKLLYNVINKQQCYKSVSAFIKDGITIKNPQQISKGFNEYFVNIGYNLSKSIQSNRSFLSYLEKSNSSSSSLSMFLTDSYEIKNVVANLKNKASSGFDDIPVTVIRKCISAITEPLVSLINCSFRTGRFPDKLKIAKVYPVFKAEAENKFENYRPISVLPSFSKNFEKVAYRRLNDYFMANSVLSDSQYGFRSNHSTFMALLEMQDKISKSLDDGNVTEHCCIHRPVQGL